MGALEVGGEEAAIVYQAGQPSSQKFGVTARIWSSGKRELHHERFPILLKLLHVVLPQDLLESPVARGILPGMGDKLVKELHEEPLFLQVIAQVAGLCVIDSTILGIKPVGAGLKKRLEGRHPRRSNGFLQALKPPVGAPDDASVRLRRLLVKGGQSLIEPGRA